MIFCSNPHIKASAIILRHEDVYGLFKFIGEINDFVITVKSEHAIKQVANGVLVVHQHAESLGEIRKQEFFPFLILHDIVGIFGGMLVIFSLLLYHSAKSFVKNFRGLSIIFNTFFQPFCPRLFCKKFLRGMGKCNWMRICDGDCTGSPPNCITRNNGSPTLRFEDDKVEDDGCKDGRG